MGRPRTYDEALREKLIEHASKMMSEDGYHGVSLRVLTRDVGTSTNAVYTLFGSKEALMAEVVVRHLDALLAQDGMAPDQGDPEQALISIASVYRDFAVSDPKSFNGAFEAIKEAKEPGSMTDRVNPELRELDKKLFDPILSACQRIADGATRKLNPHRMAVGVWALIHGYSFLGISGVLPVNSEEADTIFDEALHAMYVGWLSKNVVQLHDVFEKEETPGADVQAIVDAIGD